MCGIFGVVGKTPVAATLVEGLRRLEYRGYDSAGIATIGSHGLERLCAVGKVEELAKLVHEVSPDSTIGIAHTRWATHGAPSEDNSHPHIAPGIAVVHNGIVENYRQLRSDLEILGCKMTSETDSEVIPWIVSRSVQAGNSTNTAMQELAEWLDGSYAIALLNADEPNVIYAKRQGSPLVAGMGKDGGYIASDSHALAGLVNDVTVLEDGDQVEVRRDSIVVRDVQGMPVMRRTMKVAGKAQAEEKQYPHYMLKEIYEQPTVLRTINNRYSQPGAMAGLDALDFKTVDRVRMVACGTSYYAAMVAKTWFAEVAGMAAEVEIASEYRYAPNVTQSGREVAILVSQSGETADTLATLVKLKQQGVASIGLVNNMASSLARDVDVCFDLLAGPEIGVASTKAFTAQLATFAYIVAQAADMRGHHDKASRFRLALAQVPAIVEQVLATRPAIIPLARSLLSATTAIFVGRGSLFPLALEGALKLKEISYIHAEGFAAGELKHGPIALIDSHTPIIALAASDDNFTKIASNIQEISARGGRIATIGDDHALRELADISKAQILLPACDLLVLPIVAAIPLQLLAYETAVVRGSDVDRPRNLAKSVTVE
jgi:glucosamine--fructose-6-phosphate aminotransferase (isomerizing)